MTQDTYTYFKPKSKEELSKARIKLLKKIKHCTNTQLLNKWRNAEDIEVEIIYYSELLKRSKSPKHYKPLSPNLRYPNLYSAITHISGSIWYDRNKLAIHVYEYNNRK